MKLQAGQITRPSHKIEKKVTTIIGEKSAILNYIGILPLKIVKSAFQSLGKATASFYNEK